MENFIAGAVFALIFREMYTKLRRNVDRQMKDYYHDSRT